ncbi:MAG TPA: endonuclease III [Bacteroidales bacterium]|nr:endonuclease III [Bacteroidales bacterium]
MTTKERYKRFISWFSENMPEASTELVYQTPYELIVAVVLSAQCTDKRVNQITPAFFERFPDAATLAKASHEEVFDLIKSCSYPNNKTKNLIGMAQTLIEEFNGQVPDNLHDLETLPGVGRKTANVILSVAFDKPAMPVDTHVHRVARRIGLVKNARTPLETEKQLTRYIPKHYLSKAHHWLILHGRYVCQARKPKCDICGIKDFCMYYQNLIKPPPRPEP